MTVRFSARFLARAIKAAVDAARATILGKRFLKMLPGPVKPHGEIIPRYAQPRCDLIRLLSLQINLFQQLPILLGHQRQKTPKAFAELPLILFAECFRKLLFKTLQRAAACPLFPINIDNRSSKNSIKPRGCFLVRFGMPVGGQRFDQALLHDIFGQMVIAKAISSKRHESLEVPDDCILNACHGCEVSFCATPCKFLSQF